MQNPQLEIATAFISQLDADWAQLVQQVGPCTLTTKVERDPYQALVRAVAYQQLNTKVGDVILQRFIAHFGQFFPSPTQLLAAHFDDLRACGFSGRKIETIKGVAQARLSGVVPTQMQAQAMTNSTLIHQLTQLPGIGQWTVEMLLIFNLQRLDILPVNDLGIRQGYQRLKALAEPPKPKTLAEIGLAWKPYRSIASWYLWRVQK